MEQVEHYTYDNVEEFLDFAYAKNPTFVVSQNRETWDGVVKGDHFGAQWLGLSERVGAVTSDVMRRIVSEGWLEGMARVYERMEDLEAPPVQSVRRRLSWTDQGDHIEMTKVWNGQLDTAWQRGMRRSANGPRTIRIAVDNIYSGGDDPDSVSWRGIAAIAAAKAFTDAGHNVELVTTMKISDSQGVWHLAQIVTKAATMPLDMANVSATTALAGFFRHTGHCWFYRVATGQSYGGGGVGRTERKDIASYGVTDVYLSGNRNNSKEDAQNWVNAVVNSFAEGPNVVRA